MALMKASEKNEGAYQKIYSKGNTETVSFCQYDNQGRQSGVAIDIKREVVFDGSVSLLFALREAKSADRLTSLLVLYVSVKRHHCNR